MAKDKNTPTSKVAKGQTGRIKITGNSVQRAAKIAEHLEAGGKLSEIQVDQFTRLPDNITINADDTVTMHSHADDLTPPGIILPNGEAVPSDPNGPQDTQPIDPLAPEPFVPSDSELPLFPPGTEYVDLRANADSAPIIKYTPYQENNWGQSFSPSLVQRSNELANKVWPSMESYDLANNRRLFGGLGHGYGEKVEAAKKNAELFDHFSLRNEVQRAVGFDYPRHGMTHPFSFLEQVRETIGKVRRLEKKYGTDEIIDDIVREKIIDIVLMPTSSYGLTDGYHGGRYLDLRYPQQKAVVNEMLTKDDVSVIETTLNYVNRLRNLLQGYDHYPQAYTREELLVPLKGPAPTLSGMPPHYVGPDTHRKLLKSIKTVLYFFEQAIPQRVLHDFVPAMAGQRKSQDRFLELQKASRELREASMAFVQETGTLADLMEKVVELSTAVYHYFAAMIDEIRACYEYLDRVGMSFETLVNESRERIEQSDAPW